MHLYSQYVSIRLVLQLHLDKLVPSQMLASTTSDLEQRRKDLLDIMVSYPAGTIAMPHIEMLRLDVFHGRPDLVDAVVME